MAGIYIHVPFCKRRCRYCDFYSTTMEGLRSPYVLAVCDELVQRKAFLNKEPVETLYFGGGTPSRLQPAFFEEIFSTIKDTFGTEKIRELTIEANPDDISEKLVQEIQEAWKRQSSNACPIRFSMGIQTFDDNLLTLIGRRHTALQAKQAVETLHKAGITEISIDLMYGLPDETEEIWKGDLEQALTLGVPHISAYHLSYEKSTPLWRMLQQGNIKEVEEEKSILFFQMLRKKLLSNGYEHYEISNFALPGHQAIHNSHYWSNVPYLGIGPGAHSFDGTKREWNEGDLRKYISIKDFVTYDNSSFHHIEVSSPSERYDEYVMTHLRTAKGVSLHETEHLFGNTRKDYLLKMAQPYIADNRLTLTDDGRLVLTEKGILVSDGIIVDLFADE